MPKRIFQSFPFTPSEAEALNPVLAQLAADHGGLALILDPQCEIPKSFLDKLESLGYSADEINLYRQLVGSEERKRIVYGLACLGQLAASTEDKMLKEIYEGYFLNLSAERKAHEISFEEIGAAAAEIAPLFSAN
jgi:hypothetical protein